MYTKATREWKEPSMHDNWQTLAAPIYIYIYMYIYIYNYTFFTSYILKDLTVKKTLLNVIPFPSLSN